MAFRISPWQYSGELHGAVTEPLMYRADAVDTRPANTAAVRHGGAIVRFSTQPVLLTEH